MHINISKALFNLGLAYFALVCLGLVDAPAFGSDHTGLRPAPGDVNAVVDGTFETNSDGGWTQLRRSRSF